MRRLVSDLYVRDNCHPFKATVLVWVQLPMWIFISVALRNFSTGAAHSEGKTIIEILISQILYCCIPIEKTILVS